MSYEAINLTIYSKKSIFSPDEMAIKELINNHLSSAARITTTLDKNDVDVIINKLNTEIILENARPERIEKFFDNDLIYNSIKSIDFEFKNKINLRLYPIYGEIIDSDDLPETEINDFETLGYMSYQGGTYGDLDETFFELAETAIRAIIPTEKDDNYRIVFTGWNEEKETMNLKTFLKEINNLKNLYCNNPNFEK